jgi:hypothetical protein
MIPTEGVMGKTMALFLPRKTKDYVLSGRLMDSFVLIDYDNVPYQFRRSGLADLARRVNAVLAPLVPGADSIFIRLYGGWYDSSGLTREGTRITQEIGQSFPLIELKNGRIHSRTSCEIASALIDCPVDIFQFTFRKRSGMRSPLISAKPQNCVSVQNCTVSAVARWSRRGCPEPGCPATQHDAFTYHEQKLVDTLLCCDLLGLAGRSPAPPVSVVSDDDDFAPALLMAARLGATVHLVEMRATKGRVYGNLFGRYKVKVVNL